MPSTARTLKLDIRAIREELELSQAELAELLTVSLRTIQSCEQEWRKPSSSLEKSLLLLLMAHRNGKSFGKKRCWDDTNCSDEQRKGCVAFQSRQGHLCWLMTGTRCKGIRLKGWPDKVWLCSQCDFFSKRLKGDLPLR